MEWLNLSPFKTFLRMRSSRFMVYVSHTALLLQHRHHPSSTLGRVNQIRKICHVTLIILLKSLCGVWVCFLSFIFLHLVHLPVHVEITTCNCTYSGLSHILGISSMDLSAICSQKRLFRQPCRLPPPPPPSTPPCLSWDHNRNGVIAIPRNWINSIARIAIIVVLHGMYTQSPYLEEAIVTLFRMYCFCLFVVVFSLFRLPKFCNLDL